MSATGRPEREYRSAQREAIPSSATGRPEREYRSAQHEDSPTSLQGTAFLALWNDVAPGHEREYDAWHTREHIPERVAVPGILAGRRYAASHDEGMQRWFTLYELADVAVLDSAAYRQLVREPTPWSQAMRPHLRRFLRAACTTRMSRGTGIGGALVTVRCRDPLDAGSVRDCETLPGVTGVHWGAAEAGTAAPTWVESADTAIVAAVLLVECYGPAEAQEVKAEIVARLAQGGHTCDAGVYALRYVHDRRLAAAVE